ncbi:MAG TPA: hypothetical protein VJ844_13015, partial [Mucilaginibacter sp.]|nr:hypothetical protein [Mucilaginibacter sp.]
VLAILLLLVTGNLWAQLPKVACGTIKRLENFPSKFVDPRNVDIWLPEGYSTNKKYAVLYMHDGQALFDSTLMWNKQEWGVDETLCKLNVGTKNKGLHCGRHLEHRREKVPGIFSAEGVLQHEPARPAKDFGYRPG